MPLSTLARISTLLFCSLLQQPIHAQDELLLRIEWTSVQNPSVQSSFDGPIAGAINPRDLWLSTFRITNLPPLTDVQCSLHVADRGDLPFTSAKNWIGIPGRAIEGLTCVSPNAKILYATGSKNWGWSAPVSSGFSGSKGKNRPLGALALRYSQSGQFSPTIPVQDGGISISANAKCVWEYKNGVTYLRGEQVRISTMFWRRSPFSMPAMAAGPARRLKTAGGNSCPPTQVERLQVKFQRCSEWSVLNATGDPAGVLLSGSVTSRPGACSEALIADFVALGTIVVPGFRLLSSGERQHSSDSFEEADEYSVDPGTQAWIDAASEEDDFLEFLASHAKREDLGIQTRLALIDQLQLIGSDESTAKLKEVAEASESSVIQSAATLEKKE